MACPNCGLPLCEICVWLYSTDEGVAQNLCINCSKNFSISVSLLGMVRDEQSESPCYITYDTDYDPDYPEGCSGFTYKYTHFCKICEDEEITTIETYPYCKECKNNFQFQN